MLGGQCMCWGSVSVLGVGDCVGGNCLPPDIARNIGRPFFPPYAVSVYLPALVLLDSNFHLFSGERQDKI